MTAPPPPLSELLPLLTIDALSEDLDRAGDSIVVEARIKAHPPMDVFGGVVGGTGADDDALEVRIA